MTRLQIRITNMIILLATTLMIYTCAQVPHNPTGRIDLVDVKVRF